MRERKKDVHNHQIKIVSMVQKLLRTGESYTKKKLKLKGLN